MLDTIVKSLAPIHRAGWPFVVLAAAASLIGFWAYAPVGWILAGVTAWVAYFFRDPRSGPVS
jgi:phosphatidylserine decarboxylase